LESQIILKSLGTGKLKGLNRITKIGYGKLCMGAWGRGKFVLIIIILFKNCEFQ
jgi:hypothetical protein